MDLSKIVSISELKAMAYDEIRNSQVAQNNLAAINQRIAELESFNAAAVLGETPDKPLKKTK